MFADLINKKLILVHMRCYHRELKEQRIYYYAFALLFLGVIAIISGCSKNDTARIEANAGTLKSSTDTRPAIVAFGDSLTAAYGLSIEESYTTLLQIKLDENGYKFRVVNAGVSGDTTAGGVRRIDWALQDNPKYLILELGGNDGLRGLSVADMKKNLSHIIERAQSRNVTVILAGMEAPVNMGREYRLEFHNAFQELVKKYNIPFIPFILDGIAGRPDLNLPDGIHPNPAGEKIMTENVWKIMKPLISQKNGKSSQN